MDPQSVREMALLGVAMPLILSLICAQAIWHRAKGTLAAGTQNSDRFRLLLTGTIALAAVILLVQILLLGLPSFPPREAMHSLPLALAAGAAIGILDLFIPASRRYAPYLIGAIIVTGGMVLAYQHSWIGQAMIMGAISWMSLRWIAASHTPAQVLIPLGMFAAGTAAVLLATGNLKLAQLAVACRLSLLALFIVSRIRPRLSVAGPVLSITLAWLASLLAQGMRYGETPVWCGVMTGIAPAIAAAIATALLSKRLKSQWMMPAISGALVLAITLAAAIAGRIPPDPYAG